MGVWIQVSVTRQFGMPKLTLAGRSEVRAVYGGFGIAIGCVLAVAARSSELRAGVCLTTAAALGGMAAGRIVSTCMDRNIERMPLVYLAWAASSRAGRDHGLWPGEGSRAECRCGLRVASGEAREFVSAPSSLNKL